MISLGQNSDSRKCLMCFSTSRTRLPSWHEGHKEGSAKIYRRLVFRSLYNSRGSEHINSSILYLHSISCMLLASVILDTVKVSGSVCQKVGTHYHRGPNSRSEVEYPFFIFIISRSQSSDIQYHTDILFQFPRFEAVTSSRVGNTQPPEPIIPHAQR
jgi:hypothetical protein